MEDLTASIYLDNIGPGEPEPPPPPPQITVTVEYGVLPPVGLKLPGVAFPPCEICGSNRHEILNCPLATCTVCGSMGHLVCRDSLAQGSTH